ncbi:prefoldin subunit 1 isoform X1 [Gopherus flavomarginatus]|uniref:prefoldin subunit 1 isoform X1 n=1 Tax=Gopherus flavomarginatus TaxID=286002 RepID=UPI0021CBF6C2|nr:prefoldin subunit 1 isoform X1 [Gopherus flavomarginatus]
MAAPVDLELKKAFTELQAKVIDTQQKVKLADIQIEQLNRTKKHAHLTDTEIMTLVDETRMYEGVGRMSVGMEPELLWNMLTSLVSQSNYCLRSKVTVRSPTISSSRVMHTTQNCLSDSRTCSLLWNATFGLGKQALSGGITSSGMRSSGCRTFG